MKHQLRVGIGTVGEAANVEGMYLMLPYLSQDDSVATLGCIYQSMSRMVGLFTLTNSLPNELTMYLRREEITVVMRRVISSAIKKETKVLSFIQDSGYTESEADYYKLAFGSFCDEGLPYTLRISSW